MESRHFFTLFVIFGICTTILWANYFLWSNKVSLNPNLLTGAAIYSPGDIALDSGCIEDSECITYCMELGLGDCYCYIEEGSCYEKPMTDISTTTDTSVADSTETTSDTTTTETISNINESVKQLEQDISQVKTGVSGLEDKSENIKSGVQSLKGNYDSLSEQINQLNQNIQNLNTQQTQLKEQLKTEVNSLSTGLAANIETVKEDLKGNLTSIETTLQKEQKARKFLTYTFFTLLIIGITLGLIYYMNRQKKNSSSPSQDKEDIVSYINKHIQKGKKYEHIKKNLLNVGWTLENIESAFKEALRRNYRSQKEETEDKTPQSISPTDLQKHLAFEKHKMLSIVGTIILIIVIVSFIFVKGKTAGHAIYYQKLVDGKENGTIGEVTYATKCTSPHTLNPAGDGCCLDKNGNKICDYVEEQQAKQQLTEQKKEGETCKDNSQCSSGKKCINSVCAKISSLYEGKGDCSKSCNFYTVHISTSDGESYNLKPGKGSYTAVGALEWRIISNTPDHCKGEPAAVPIEIIRKKPGEIINQETITLRRGETSEVLTHPNIKSVAFTLKVDEIFEVCN